MQTTAAVLYRNLYTYFWISFLSTGLGTPIRRGLSSISLVRWSPSGDYLLAAKLYVQISFSLLASSSLIFQNIYTIRFILAMELFTSGRQTHGLQNPGLHPMVMSLYVIQSSLKSEQLHFKHSTLCICFPCYVSVTMFYVGMFQSKD